MYSRLHPRNGFYQILVSYICLFLFALSSILSSMVLYKLFYFSLLSITSAKKKKSAKKVVIASYLPSGQASYCTQLHLPNYWSWKSLGVLTFNALSYYIPKLNNNASFFSLNIAGAFSWPCEIVWKLFHCQLWTITGMSINSCLAIELWLFHINDVLFVSS